MLIPDKEGHYIYNNQKVIEYNLRLDEFNAICEYFITEDGERWGKKHYWFELNDIEKHICKTHGIDLDSFYREEIPLKNEEIAKKTTWLYKGKPIRNLECYFLESGAYIEEFDTDDGHFCTGCDIPDYPEEIRQEAIKQGIIDENGTLLLWDGRMRWY